MTNDNYVQKLEELDRLLNDPSVPLQPALIWQLLGEMAKHEASATSSRCVAMIPDAVT
jgi:hypothetical protein